MSNQLRVSEQKAPEAAVPIHGPEAFAGMRRAGRLAAEVLDMVTEHVQPGVTTAELDRRCHDFILERGATPARSTTGAIPSRPASRSTMRYAMAFRASVGCRTATS